MAYMVHQRFASAIKDAYREKAERSEIQRQLDEARRTRDWLEALEIDGQLRASLVEPIAVVEDAFRGLLGASRTGRDAAD